MGLTSKPSSTPSSLPSEIPISVQSATSTLSPTHGKTFQSSNSNSAGAITMTHIIVISVGALLIVLIGLFCSGSKPSGRKKTEAITIGYNDESQTPEDEEDKRIYVHKTIFE